MKPNYLDGRRRRLVSVMSFGVCTVVIGGGAAISGHTYNDIGALRKTFKDL